MKQLLLFFMAVLSRAACLPVESDRVLARDIAAAVPEFAKISPDELITYAPLPGVKRLLTRGELVRIGRRLGMEISAGPDLCVEYPTAPLDREMLMAALRHGLARRDAEIDLIDSSQYAAPSGTLVFPREGLSVFSKLTAESPVIWRGYVSFAGTKRFPIWARVRLAVRSEQLVAAMAIRAGETLRAEQVRTETVKQFAFLDQPAVTLDAAIGRVARRTIAAGSAITSEVLQAPNAVNRGDEVAVRVTAGVTQLSLAVRAESSGGIGDVVYLKNPVSGKLFRGVVEGKDQVSVTAQSEEKR
jgi:flagella basal body P-ring formation protein FlgA